MDPTKIVYKIKDGAHRCAAWSELHNQPALYGQRKGTVPGVLVTYIDDATMKISAWNSNQTASSYVKTTMLNNSEFLDTLNKTYQESSGNGCGKLGNKKQQDLFDAFLKEQITNVESLKKIKQTLKIWRKCKKELIDYLTDLYNEDDIDRRVHPDDIDKVFNVNKCSHNTFLDCDGPVQVELIQKTIKITQMKSVLKNGYTSPIMKFKNNYNRWWKYCLDSQEQLKLFKVEHDRLLNLDVNASIYVTKWNSACIIAMINNIEEDKCITEITTPRRAGFLMPTLNTMIKNEESSLILNLEKIKQAKANAAKIEKEIARSVENKRIAAKIAADKAQAAQRHEEDIARAKKKDADALKAFVMASKVIGATENQDNPSSIPETTEKITTSDNTSDNTNDSIYVSASTFSQLSNAMEQEEPDADSMVVMRASTQGGKTLKAGRPAGMCNVDTESLGLIGADPSVLTDKEDDTYINQRFIFGYCDQCKDRESTLWEGRQHENIGGPTLGYWYSKLDAGLSGRLPKTHEYSFDLMFLVLTDMWRFSSPDADSFGDKGWVRALVQLYKSLLANDGWLLIVVMQDLDQIMRITELLGDLEFAVVRSLVILPSNPNSVPLNVLCASKSQVETEEKEGCYINPKPDEGFFKNKYNAATIMGPYKQAKNKYALTTDKDHRRCFKRNRERTKSIYYNELNLAVVIHLIQKFSREGAYVYEGDGGQGVIPMAALRTGRRCFLVVLDLQEGLSNHNRLYWYYMILKYHTKTLPVAGEPAPDPTEMEKWAEVQNGKATRGIHSEFLAMKAEVSDTIKPFLKNIQNNKKGTKRKAVSQKVPKNVTFNSILAQYLNIKMSEGTAVTVFPDHYSHLYSEHLLKIRQRQLQNLQSEDKQLRIEALNCIYSKDPVVFKIDSDDNIGVFYTQDTRVCSETRESEILAGVFGDAFLQQNDSDKLPNDLDLEMLEETDIKLTIRPDIACVSRYLKIDSEKKNCTLYNHPMTADQLTRNPNIQRIFRNRFVVLLDTHTTSMNASEDHPIQLCRDLEIETDDTGEWFYYRPGQEDDDEFEYKEGENDEDAYKPSKDSDEDKSSEEDSDNPLPDENKESDEERDGDKGSGGKSNEKSAMVLRARRVMRTSDGDEDKESEEEGDGDKGSGGAKADGDVYDDDDQEGQED